MGKRITLSPDVLSKNAFCLEIMKKHLDIPVKIAYNTIC